MAVETMETAATPAVAHDPGYRRVIEPVTGWAPLNLGKLWRYRELLYFLAWRDIKVRYKQTVLGVAWAVLQPLLTMGIFWAIFGRAVGVNTNGVPYPVFAFVALVPWTLFSYALTQSSGSLVNSANLLAKVAFPRLVIPIAASLAGLVDFVISFLVLVPLLIIYDQVPSSGVLLLPLLVLLAMAAALAVGIWLSALMVKYRDVRYTIPFLAQIWMYATPVAYPASLVHGKLRTVFELNPMAGVIEGFRWALLRTGVLDVQSVLISTVVTLLLLVSGLFYFRRMEQTFADVV